MFKIKVAFVYIKKESNLCLLLMKLFTEAGPVVRWFTTQQKIGGGYGSTQVSLSQDDNSLHVKLDVVPSLDL